MRHEKKLTMRTAIAGTLALGVVAVGATTASASPAHSRSGDTHTRIAGGAPTADRDHDIRTTPDHRWRTGVRAAAGASPARITTAASTTTATAATTTTTTPSTTTLAGLSGNTQRLHSVVLSRWPDLTSFSGYRAGAGDHGTGHALDIMVPGWSSAAGRAQGQAVADYVRAHATELGVTYVIWRQHIWSVARSSEGWRLMEDRGSPTQNHFDHVHVSVS